MKAEAFTSLTSACDSGFAPTAIDLFSGAGGFSLGAYLAGMKVLAAVESNGHAARTYQRNLIDSDLTDAILFEEDILTLDPKSLLGRLGLATGECDLLLGGPPCQGFSAHRIKDSGVSDPRNELLLRYFEYVRIVRPLYFLVENVPGLLWPRHRGYIEKFYATAGAANYHVFEPIVLNAKDFGVPQNRRRVFILGYDADIVLKPDWPLEPSHFDPANGSGKPLWQPASTAFEKPAPEGDPNDVHMMHGKELIDVFRDTPHNGGSRRDSGRILPCHRMHRGHNDVYGRINPAVPAPTMTTACINPSKGRFVHPTEDHGITLRQAARLQGFPDWYIFEGGLMAGGIQVGNAVPVQLAQALTSFIADSIRRVRMDIDNGWIARRA